MVRGNGEEDEEIADPIAGIASHPGSAGILLDFDGTLAPIVARPELARIQPGAREAIESLAARYAAVAVISGRPSTELAHLVNVAGVALVGLYGLEAEGGEAATSLPESLLAEVESIARAQPGAWVERKGPTATVHVREADDPNAAEDLLFQPLVRLAGAEGFDVMRGKRALELVPSGRPLKGAAVQGIVRDHGLTAVLYAGDDAADLPAFHALDALAASGVGCARVAVRGTETPAELIDAADLVVEGPGELVELLASL